MNWKKAHNYCEGQAPISSPLAILPLFALTRPTPQPPDTNIFLWAFWDWSWTVSRSAKDSANDVH